MHARVYVQTQQNSLRGKNILQNALQQSDRNLAEADDGNYLQPRASGVVLQFKCKHLRGMLAVSRSATLGTILDPNRELYKESGGDGPCSSRIASWPRGCGRASHYETQWKFSRVAFPTHGAQCQHIPICKKWWTHLRTVATQEWICSHQTTDGCNDALRPERSFTWVVGRAIEYW